ncbi:glutathionylspermidine synthase [Lottiidibacillus patelloidae]|uniref:Glutathionylspermidine synthase n=1 Tax=Lottiidibacillus patelloidae TaxID=2670334 RepID=A0A263BT18_9BACI|nr:glutathionylspermidine synthase family protein [Lottiidibacillus patelloidae]OZM56854.1 glutathionylspermidine synthase [Lottiidibacillus patelloidae]
MDKRLSLQTYSEKRKAFYAKVENYWPDMYGQEYSLYDIKKISSKEQQDILLASQKISHIFLKTAHLLRTLDDETLLQMGFPKETLSFIRLKTMQTETVISRLDLVKTENGIKVLEINSDTPTFIKELFHINGLVCQELGSPNPNEGMENQLAKAVQHAIFEAYSYLGKDEFPSVVFTSHADSEEDKYTVQYLQALSEVPSSYVPLHELKIVENEGLFDHLGNKIDVLYRQTFPIENMIEDKDPNTGENVGSLLMQLVEQKKLAIVNPPSAFLLQSKAVQAVVWGLHEEQSPFFTEEEHQWIQQFFLPTYLEADAFLARGEKYVKKPCFGREGDTVEVYENGKKVLEDANKSYTEYLAIYQKYIDLPKTTFMSEKGEQVGHLMIGSFLLNGKPSSIGYRVGAQITDNLSYYLPIGIKK